VQKNGAAYMLIRNRGGEPERLLAARTAEAQAAELHGTTVTPEGVARMRPAEAVEIPPGGEAELMPGGPHVTLVGLKAPLFEGVSFPMTLVFERAGEVAVDVGGVPPEVLTDPLDGVGQVSQLAGDATAREWHVGIVVGAAVAGRQGALGDEAGAVAAGVLCRRGAFAEPTVDVLHDADHPAGGGVELVGLVGEVVPVRSDLAVKGTAEPAEVVGAGVEVVLDRCPVRAPRVGAVGHVGTPFCCQLLRPVQASSGGAG
jgi:hypothetical protein